MKVFGEYGLGHILKILLQCLFGSMAVVSFCAVFINKKIIVFYPNIISFLVIVYAFIGLFDLLKNEEPFCEKTVKKINIAKVASLICSLFWLMQALYEIFLVKGDDIFFNIFLLFMFILFFGVAIALYVLKELFIKATNYKKENDLTI